MVFSRRVSNPSKVGTTTIKMNTRKWEIIGDQRRCLRAALLDRTLRRDITKLAVRASFSGSSARTRHYSHAPDSSS
jgi:hypothetical protein